MDANNIDQGVGMESGKSPPSEDRRNFILDALETFEGPLTRYARRMCGTQMSQETAKDAVQHTFLKLCQQDVESVKGKLGPWLFSVCRNRIVDQLRAKGKRSEHWLEPFDVADSQVGPAEKAEHREFLDRLSQRIGELKGPQREVIELWSQGFDHGEIAEILNKSRGAVRIGLHRAIKQLQKHPEVYEWLERATGPSKNKTSKSGPSNAKRASQSAEPTLSRGKNS